jgi:hypothetical protein
MAAWVSRQIGLLWSARVTDTATQSREILAELRKIWLTRKTELCKTWGQETGRRERCCSKQKASSTVVPKGYYQDTKKRLQKMRQRELFVKKEEEERDYWFNHLWPMTKPKQTWREKWLPKEEGSSYDDSNGGEAGRLTPARGEYNLGSGDGNLESGNCNPKSGDCHPESGNRNLDSGDTNSGKEND